MKYIHKKNIVPYTKMEKDFNASYFKVVKILNIFLKSDEYGSCGNDSDNGSCYLTLLGGCNYKKEKKEKKRENIKLWIPIIISLLALILSIISLIITNL